MPADARNAQILCQELVLAALLLCQGRQFVFSLGLGVGVIKEKSTLVVFFSLLVFLLLKPSLCHALVLPIYTGIRHAQTKNKNKNEDKWMSYPPVWQTRHPHASPTP